MRTFAGQVKHVAASNYFIWSPLTGDKMPEGLKDGNGPQGIKTKAEVISFLKDSFALGHKAVATLSTENMCRRRGAANQLACAWLCLASSMLSITTDSWWNICG